MNRLAALEIDGAEEGAVRAAFDLSYRPLPPQARQLFRRLALVPGPDFTAAAGTVLLDLAPEDGRQADELIFCRVTQMGLLRLLSNPAIMDTDAVDRWPPWTASFQGAIPRFAWNRCSPESTASRAACQHGVSAASAWSVILAASRGGALTQDRHGPLASDRRRNDGAAT
jgi:hypothetical protein